MKLKQILAKSIPFILFIFSSLLFLYKNNQVPPSLFSDEADANYQAFVFNQRQTDYFGNKFPVHFHSYSDWRTSLYIYSIALTQKFIGHVDLAARFPAAIFGSLSVILFFFILKLLFKKNIWASIGAILFCITPWLFHYSRVGFEATGMLLFLLLGIYFWIKFINLKSNKFLFLSIVSFIITVYFYSTAKLFLLLIAIVMAILWFKTLIHLPLKTKIISIALILILSFPFVLDTFKGRAGYRFSYINIFTDPTINDTVNFNRHEDSVLLNGNKIGLSPTLTSKIFYNKATICLEAFVKNYLSSFSTNFLFLTGDSNLRQGIQTNGNLLLPDLLLIIIGISSIFYRKSKNHKLYLFFFFSLILAPIPFSLTRDSISPHATRLFLMLPFLSFFSILGFQKIYKLTKSKFLITIILVIYILCFSRFYHQYFFHYPNISAREWHFGMKQAVTETTKTTNYSKIYFINSYEPFIPFFLNYSEYLPQNISPAEALIWDNNEFFTGMQTENKYYLGNIEWSVMFNQLPQNTLFVISQKELSKIKSSLTDYNNNHKQNINLIEINKTDKKFTEQEQLYLITFKQ